MAWYDELAKMLLPRPGYTLPLQPPHETHLQVFDNQLRPGFFRTGRFPGSYPNPERFGGAMWDLLDRRPGTVRGWDARDRNMRNRPNPSPIVRRYNV